MPTNRPLECPTCGHEGINRTPPRLKARFGSSAAASETWTCRLCAYSWSRPAPPPPSGEVDAVQL